LILLTNDRGFADIRHYPPGSNAGIIVLRMAAETESKVHGVLLRMLAAVGREELRTALAVVSDNKYRLRR
jgi:hypothetical protein